MMGPARRRLGWRGEPRCFGCAQPRWVTGCDVLEQGPWISSGCPARDHSGKAAPHHAVWDPIGCDGSVGAQFARKQACELDTTVTVRDERERVTTTLLNCA